MNFLLAPPRKGAIHYGPSGNVASESIMARMFGYGATKGFGTITEYMALNLPAVSCAIGIIATGMAQLPADVIQKDAKGKRTKLDNHPVSKLLNRQSNPYMTPFTLRETTMYHTLGWGNGYIEIERDGAGRPVSLWPLLPNCTRPEKTPDKSDVVFKTWVDGKTFTIPKEDVLHVQAMGFDGYIGYSPISMHRQAIALGLAAQEFGEKFFTNDAKSGGFLQHPGKLGDTAVKNLTQSVNANSGLDNAHRVRVLEEGMKFVQTTIAPDDAQFLGTREFQIAEIARIYRVPAVLLQAMTKATTWGSGIEQMMIGFVVWTLQSWVIKTEQEWTRKLLTADEIESGMYIKLNIAALLRGDMAARSGFYKESIVDGWRTRNEVRALEDLNPLPGLDEPLVPLNMGPSDQLGKDNEPPVKGLIDGNEDESDDEDDLEKDDAAISTALKKIKE